MEILHDRDPLFVVDTRAEALERIDPELTYWPRMVGDASVIDGVFA